jgi:glyoxylate utilization-related uncharacterized protein
MSLQQLAKDTCIVRNTAGHKGRTIAVEPGAASRYLYYGRIVLDAGDAPIRFDTNQLETGLICLKGSATVRANNETFALGRYDSVYVPRDGSIEVTPGPTAATSRKSRRRSAGSTRCSSCASPTCRTTRSCGSTPARRRTSAR